MDMPSTRQRLGWLIAVPIFAGLDPIELAAIDGLLTPRPIRKGDVLFRRGDRSDGLFLLTEGELEVLDPSGPGDPVVLRRLRAPDVAGELGMVLGGPRTADVVATADGAALVLDGEQFHRLAAREPAIMQNVCRVLAQRMTATPAERVGPTATVVGVSWDPGSAPLGSTVAAWLDAHLAAAPAGELRLTDAAVDIRRAVAAARESAPWVSVRIGDRVSPDVVATICDVVVHVGAADSVAAGVPAGVRCVRVVDATGAATSPIPVSRVDPFVVVGPALPAGLDDAEACRAFLAAEPGHPLVRTLGRLGRHLTGDVVGVTLGGGAAMGLAHIGVLQVLTDEGIPVDAVAATGLGSIVAVGFASGLSPRDMATIAIGAGASWRDLLAQVDPDASPAGFLAGERIEALLRPYLGTGADFCDLLIPCRTVATDLDSGERVEWTEGPLLDATRASSSFPLLVAPVAERGRVLVDGTLIDPVPVEMTRAMGVDRVIAVNVVPPLGPDSRNAIARLSARLGRTGPETATEAGAAVNLLDVAITTIQSLQHRLGHYTAASADVRLDPVVDGFTPLDFWHAEEIIERGAAAARDALPALRALATPASAAG